MKTTTIRLGLVAIAFAGVASIALFALKEERDTVHLNADALRASPTKSAEDDTDRSRPRHTKPVAPPTPALVRGTTVDHRVTLGPVPDALDSLSSDDRATIETVASYLERPARDVATWALEWNAIGDLRDLHALLDDDGGRPHMRSALEAYMEMREQIPTNGS